VTPERLEEADLRNHRSKILAPIGPAAVRIRETIVARQLPGREDVAGTIEYFRIRRERRNGPPDEQRRLGLQEVLVLLAAIAPVCLRHAEVLEHRFRSQKAGRDGYRRHAAALQLTRHACRKRFERALHDIRQGIATAAKHGIAFGDFHDQPALPLHHDGRRVLGGDQVRDERLLQRVAAALEIGLPERGPATEERVLAANAVDQHVEALLFLDDARKKRFHVGFDAVVDAHRDAAAPDRRHHVRGFVDRFGPVVRRGLAAAAAAGAIHSRAGFAEGAGNAAAGAARGASDDGDVAGEGGGSGHGSASW